MNVFGMTDISAENMIKSANEQSSKRAKKIKTTNCCRNFDINTSAKMLERSEVFPCNGESIRMLSPAGGWSSCSLVVAIANECKIKQAFITTLRVGKKELVALEHIGIQHVSFCLGGIAKENAAKYDYAKNLDVACERNGWTRKYIRNHSKIILLDTDRGKIAIETSSNFNENPQIEQFCVTNSTDVYDFYLEQLREVGAFD